MATAMEGQAMGILRCFGDMDKLLTPYLFSGVSPQINTPRSLLLRDSAGEIKEGNSGCQVFSSYQATRERKSEVISYPLATETS